MAHPARHGDRRAGTAAVNPAVPRKSHLILNSAWDDRSRAALIRSLLFVPFRGGGFQMRGLRRKAALLLLAAAVTSSFAVSSPVFAAPDNSVVSGAVADDPPGGADPSEPVEEEPEEVHLPVGEPTVTLSSIVDKHAAATDEEAEATLAALPRGSYLYFVYDKGSGYRGVLRLYLFRNFPDRPNTVLMRSYASGSGVKRDACKTNVGWLPNGDYRVKGTFKHYDGKIKGNAIWVEDKHCKSGGRGTLRTELFIHSEMTKNGGQDCTPESTCWNGDTDFKSNGCVKLRPNDIKDAFSLFRSFGNPKMLYVKS
ncbi:hypothetical protein ABZ345_21680 [Lentzea sp. NPDC005914]|uniref:hypothetical protein n=1 Tax=Lentzea sp. NPDC005914 TaxID=3154572 RepID=UPI003403657A